MVLSGQTIRTAAMITCGTNFTHLVATEKKQGHQLVTKGIYSYFRHPSYLGWYLWAVGTQLLLVNPISLVGYTIAIYFFFKDRIEFEEITLLSYFGDQYQKYKKTVPSGIPFL
eukprot:Sdes_comp17017_c0_seq2m6219